MNRVIELRRGQFGEAAAVISQAFAQDPLMLYFYEDVVTPRRVVLQAQFRFLCERHASYGWPILAVSRGGRLAGVAFPVPPSSAGGRLSDTADRAQAEFTSLITPQARARLDRYGEISELMQPDEPHIFVMTIGVAPAVQRQGIGRRLLDAIAARSERTEESCGVGLDTENPINVPWYESQGFRVHATAQMDGVTIWSMFRPFDPHRPPDAGRSKVL